LKTNIEFIANRCGKTRFAHPVLSNQQDVPWSAAGASKEVGECFETSYSFFLPDDVSIENPWVPHTSPFLSIPNENQTDTSPLLSCY
jgi:hypothetical protein